MSTAGYFTNMYYGNLERIWDSLLPAPDIRVIKENGDIETVDQAIASIAKHYLHNIAQLAISLVFLPFTFVFSSISSLLQGRVTVKQHPHQLNNSHTPEAFGFANSLFQDSGVGTDYDTSSLKGLGIGDWNKILKRHPQIVTKNGEKTGKITHGITLQENDSVEDLFVNIIDHPVAFAQLLKDLGCSAYRVSLERSVIEPKPGEFNDTAIQKYHDLANALINEGITPWFTLHHFTNPQWFEDLGGFTSEDNINGFVQYCEEMVDRLDIVENWMTFNEPGIRGLEAFVRGEHPPEKKDIPTAAKVVRNLLIAHTKAYAAMKAKNKDLNIGITHQWLKFLPLGGNPIEKITAHFFTNLAHSPFNFFKDGVMKIKIPFKANVQLRYENKTAKKIADFLGVQAYGFPRIKIGFNRGKPYPGAADKVTNFTLPFLGLGFTAGSTRKGEGSMQYFGPPCEPNDLIDVLDEAFTIPKERIPAIGITETGSDAKRMNFGEENFEVDNAAQAKAIGEIFKITQSYNLACLFFWTLNRHCEWKSGNMSHLGFTKLRNEQDGSISYENTAAIEEIREIFQKMKAIPPEEIVA